jgi:hypothetical protein
MVNFKIFFLLKIADLLGVLVPKFTLDLYNYIFYYLILIFFLINLRLFFNSIILQQFFYFSFKKYKKFLSLLYFGNSKSLLFIIIRIIMGIFNFFLTSSFFSLVLILFILLRFKLTSLLIWLPILKKSNFVNKAVNLIDKDTTPLLISLGTGSCDPAVLDLINTLPSNFIKNSRMLGMTLDGKSIGLATIGLGFTSFLLSSKYFTPDIIPKTFVLSSKFFEKVTELNSLPVYKEVSILDFEAMSSNYNFFLNTRKLLDTEITNTTQIYHTFQYLTKNQVYKDLQNPSLVKVFEQGKSGDIVREVIVQNERQWVKNTDCDLFYHSITKQKEFLESHVSDTVYIIKKTYVFPSLSEYRVNFNLKAIKVPDTNFGYIKPKGESSELLLKVVDEFTKINIKPIYESYNFKILYKKVMVPDKTITMQIKQIEGPVIEVPVDLRDVEVQEKTNLFIKCYKYTTELFSVYINHYTLTEHLVIIGTVSLVSFGLYKLVKHYFTNDNNNTESKNSESEFLDSDSE